MTAFFYANTFTYINESVIQYRINLSTSLIGGNSKTPLCVYEAYKKTYDRIKDEAGFDKVRQSFLNKAMRACFYFLSVQTKFESYEVHFTISIKMKCLRNGIILKIKSFIIMKKIITDIRE